MALQVEQRQPSDVADLRSLVIGDADVPEVALEPLEVVELGPLVDLGPLVPELVVSPNRVGGVDALVGLGIVAARRHGCLTETRRTARRARCPLCVRTGRSR